MTFDQQVRWSCRWGLRLLLIGGAGVAVVLGMYGVGSGAKAPPFGLAEVPMLVSYAGIVLFLVGGLIRPAHRWVYFKLVAPNAFWRGASLWHPLLRNWAWVDQDGKDRDA